MSEQSASIEIEHREDGGRGEFFVEPERVRLAEMMYTRRASHSVTIVHTLVEEELRGQGIARRLLDTLVSWARKTGTRVHATCVYAKAQFEKDASIRDVYDGPG